MTPYWLFSPHTRGCSFFLALLNARKLVFPAYAGMFRTPWGARCVPQRFPRIRGDVPSSSSLSPLMTRFSPHTRGCSGFIAAVNPLHVVFPAYAGMFLPVAPSSACCLRFSPHTRGCSLCDLGDHRNQHVFPAYAGMFPVRPRRSPESACFPRIRGDVATPRPRHHPLDMFSPHTRGCSVYQGVQSRFPGVFPAYAGMFLSRARRIIVSSSFPRIRGDVPRLPPLVKITASFSPHTRGCSQVMRIGKEFGGVFPAYAGMFRPP